MIAPIPALILALALQGEITVNVGGGRRDTTRAPVSVISDSAYRARAARDSVRVARRRSTPVTATANDIATAFADAGARSLLELARQARLGQDSALLGYDAKAYERFTIGMALSRIARQRIFLRYERAARVQWSRDHGARIEITGERTTAPLIGDAKVELGDFPPVPYFPGREPLWGAMLARANVEEDDIINPIAAGAEKYYIYSSGDVATFRLPGGQVINIREIRVRPRSPRWSVLIASLWVDASNGRLVRAAYRMAEPMDILAEERAENNGDDGCDARWICAALSPMTANIPVATVEYGLHEGRFWLPRVQLIEGMARVGFMRVPFKIEQSYRYESVNGSVPFTPVTITAADTASDSLSRARRVEVRRSACVTGTHRERTVLRFERTLPISMRVPCDTAALGRSPDLPRSALDPGEEVFGSAETEELVRRALDLGAQAGFSPRPIQWEHPIRTTRYNRIEGFSPGVAAKQSLGAGLTARGELRFGFADRQVNGELGVTRSNGRVDVGVNAYRRLAVTDDWGDPFSLGSSLGALVSGRDDAFYYRALGVELTRGPTDGPGFLSRLFVERHDAASTEASASLARAINGRRFRPNIGAEEGAVGGAAVRWTASRGLDPRAFRAVSDMRLEAAAGSFDYARAAWDLTLSRAFGAVAAALTGAAGTSGGHLPVQRWWYMGGAYTVRGQSPGTLRGNSFWLTRAELGSSFPLARPVVFADLGWAGDRARFGSPGRPISGAGVGASFLDGMIRFDVAKGIRPASTVRGYLYLEARF